MIVNDNPINEEYNLQHSKWGDLRNKLKSMKLDNYTVRTYRKCEKNGVEFPRGMGLLEDLQILNTNGSAQPYQSSHNFINSTMRLSRVPAQRNSIAHCPRANL